jgi:hypothetical protein
MLIERCQLSPIDYSDLFYCWSRVYFTVERIQVDTHDQCVCCRSNCEVTDGKRTIVCIQREVVFLQDYDGVMRVDHD